MNEVESNVDKIGSAQRLDTIRRWLAPPDSSTNANHARKLRHEGTGNWFLVSPIFLEWTSRRRRSLWLHGLPGCGKTVLLTTAYDYITQELGTCTVVLQFYFDFGDERKQTVDSMLHGLIFQIHTLQVEPTSELNDIFKRYNHGRDQPDGSALSDCLHKMLKDLPTTFVFIDALDECSQRVELLNWMRDFMAVPDLSHVQLMMTARPEAEFNHQLPSLIHECNCVSLQTELMNADIKSYVQSSLERRPGFKKWISVPATLQQISLEVGSKADGM